MNTYDVAPQISDFTTEELARAFSKYLKSLGETEIASTIDDGSWLTFMMNGPFSKPKTKLVADPEALLRNRLAPVREH